MCQFHSHSTVIQDTLKIGRKHPIVLRAREQVSEQASERTNERSGARAKRAVWSKRVSERCEQTSERMNEWLITNVRILRGSESQCILPIVRPKRVSAAAAVYPALLHLRIDTC